MSKQDYIYECCLSLLEDKLPPELFKEVMNYLKNDAIEEAEKLTQAERVFNHLMEHGEITNMQCHLLYGIRHCPSVIRDIKKKLELEHSRYEIDTKPAKGCNRYGEKTNWLVYYLKQKTDINGQVKLFA